MYIYPCQKNIKNIITILFILGSTSLLCAQEQSTGSLIPETKKGNVIFKRGSSTQSSRNLSQKEENLSELQKEARTYRAQGLEFQRIGNIEAALSLYQKAVELDPTYAVAYNDLGVIYEASGAIDRAEESYLKCVNIDPAYLSVYTNLALLYENKRDLDKAAFYWAKRLELGSPDDPWTQKAKQRLEDIRLVLSDKPFEQAREQEIIGFLKDVATQKSLLKEDDKALAKQYFEKAKQSYNKDDFATAFKEALDAKQLDPANKEIEEFIKKVQTRALSR